jgi:hypothetical protein
MSKKWRFQEVKDKDSGSDGAKYGDEDKEDFNFIKPYHSIIQETI